MKIQLNFGNRIFVLQGLIRRRRSEYVAGYTNRCEDGRYVIFLDYDNIDLDLIVSELNHLQDMFELGDFHILQSSKDSYHAICLNKVSIHEYLTILNNSTVDSAYKDVPLYFGKKVWTLRATDKNNIPVKYIKTITGIYNEYAESSAHAEILNKLFKINIKLEYPDKSKKVIIARYPI